MILPFTILDGIILTWFYFSYGDEKPASEMIFSYGFLESDRAEESQVLLDMRIPEDDPLGFAKNMFCRETPGIRLSTALDAESSSRISWDSPLIWLACVNEEDGLHIEISQTNDGEIELETTWKSEKLTSPHHLQELLASDQSWDIYRLRAVVLLLERLEVQLSLVRETEEVLENLKENETIFKEIFRPEIYDLTARLRKLEGALFEKAATDLVNEVSNLLVIFGSFLELATNCYV